MVQLEFSISFHNQETVNTYKYELACQLVFLSSFGICSSVQDNFGFMLETPSLEWILCGHLLFLSLFLFFTKSMLTVQWENQGGSTQWGQEGTLAVVLCYTDCAWSLAFLILPEVNIYWNNFVSGIWWEQMTTQQWQFSWILRDEVLFTSDVAWERGVTYEFGKSSRFWFKYIILL